MAIYSHHASSLWLAVYQSVDVPGLAVVDILSLSISLWSKLKINGCDHGALIGVQQLFDYSVSYELLQHAGGYYWKAAP